MFKICYEIVFIQQIPPFFIFNLKNEYFKNNAIVVHVLQAMQIFDHFTLYLKGMTKKCIKIYFAREGSLYR